MVLGWVTWKDLSKLPWDAMNMMEAQKSKQILFLAGIVLKHQYRTLERATLQRVPFWAQLIAQNQSWKNGQIFFPLSSLPSLELCPIVGRKKTGQESYSVKENKILCPTAKISLPAKMSPPALALSWSSAKGNIRRDRASQTPFI